MMESGTDFKKIKREIRANIAKAVKSIPAILGMNIMIFCGELGEALGKSDKTVYDYIQRGYIPKEYTNDSLFEAIEKAVTGYCTSEAYDGSDPEKKEAVRKNWEKHREYFLSIIKIGFDQLAFVEGMEYTTKNIIPDKILSRIMITLFMRSDISQIKEIGSEEDCKKLLSSLQSYMRNIPEIEKILVSQEVIDTYFKIERAIIQPMDTGETEDKK